MPNPDDPWSQFGKPAKKTSGSRKVSKEAVAAANANMNDEPPPEATPIQCIAEAVASFQGAGFNQAVEMFRKTARELAPDTADAASSKAMAQAIMKFSSSPKHYDPMWAEQLIEKAVRLWREAGDEESAGALEAKLFEHRRAKFASIGLRLTSST